MQTPPLFLRAQYSLPGVSELGTLTKVLSSWMPVPSKSMQLMEWLYDSLLNRDSSGTFVTISSSRRGWHYFSGFPLSCPDSSNVHIESNKCGRLSGMAAVSFSSEHINVLHPQSGMESTLGKLVRAGRESKKRFITDDLVCFFLVWPGSQAIRSKPTHAHQLTSRGDPREEMRKNRREAPGVHVYPSLTHDQI